MQLAAGKLAGPPVEQPGRQLETLEQWAELLPVQAVALRQIGKGGADRMVRCEGAGRVLVDLLEPQGAQARLPPDLSAIRAQEPQQQVAERRFA